MTEADMKQRNNNKLAVQMLIAMVGGILIGLVFMAAREMLGAEKDKKAAC